MPSMPSNPYEHYPSDAFLGTGDDSLLPLVGSGSYLIDEGTILTHNYGLFDEINCAGGELWDQATGQRFADMGHVTDTGLDGLAVMPDSVVFGVGSDKEFDNDPAAQWLREHGDGR